MHRSTTSAALLVSVAVSALSGCVTVQRPPTPGPPPAGAPSQSSAPRTDGSAKPRVVQAPAREALEMVGPPRRPKRSGNPAPPPQLSKPHRSPAPAAHPAPQPHREPRHQPPAGIPDVPRSVPQAPDVCSLGTKYGGWRPDSPEAVICRRTYGQ
ncbi:hypothetical protein ABZ864_11820 [Streptomyces sp. NPDC047082]|uniref:hypothetical protein n=1 Tax=Streptomyces sp. NPDC047082 TaxID=3155259 RepID=UPI0033EF65FB